MRISNTQIRDQGVTAILNQEAKLAKTQLQLATGERVLSPADDPAASIRIVKFTESLENLKQYQRNIEVTRGRLALEDTALEQATGVLQRARELTVQARNDTLTPSDRSAIATELSRLTEEMASLANTRNDSGEYIFAGYKTAAPPYIASTVQSQGYVFQGTGDPPRDVLVGPTRRIEDSDSGYGVFENVPSASVAGQTNQNRQSVLNILHNLTQTLQGQPPGAPALVAGTSDIGRISLGAPISFDLEVYDSNATNTGTITLPAGDYADIQAVVKGINANLGTLSGHVVAQADGNKLQLVTPETGETISLSVTNDPDGFLSTTAGFTVPATVLGVSPEGLIGSEITNALTDLDSALSRIDTLRATVGARLNTLDEQFNVNEKFQVDTKASLSEVHDLDYAEAISRFNLQEIALQAAQETFVRVQNLSLFNFLN